MRIIVCGGRDFDDRALLAGALYDAANVRSSDQAVIVHGAQRGADTIAGECAETWGLTAEPHRARVDLYGSPAAFHIRNQEMVDAGADLVLALPGGSGTADCVRRAKRAGIPVRFVRSAV